MAPLSLVQLFPASLAQHRNIQRAGGEILQRSLCQALSHEAILLQGEHTIFMSRQILVYPSMSSSCRKTFEMLTLTTWPYHD